MRQKGVAKGLENPAFRLGYSSMSLAVDGGARVFLKSLRLGEYRVLQGLVEGEEGLKTAKKKVNSAAALYLKSTGAGEGLPQPGSVQGALAWGRAGKAAAKGHAGAAAIHFLQTLKFIDQAFDQRFLSR